MTPAPLDSPAPSRQTVVPAVLGDVFRISGLTRDAPEDCIPILPVTAARRLSEFGVVRGETGLVVGAVAVHRLDSRRSELRSLCVARTARGRGLGTALVRWAISRSREAGTRLLCVTKRPGFFARLGFGQVPLGAVPDKPGCGEGAGEEGRTAMALARARTAGPARQRGGMG